MQWFEEFNRHVVQNFGEVRSNTVKKYLGSFFWKIMLADYHAEESMGILSNSIPENAKNPQYEAVKQIILVSSGAGVAGEIKIAWFKSEAHIIAYAQSLHSSCDILAKAIYHGLYLDNHLDKPLKLRYQNLFSVRDGMKSSKYAQNVIVAIDQFLRSNEFLYLHTYVNQSKHRSLISSSPRVSLEQGKHGLMISEFEYYEPDSKKIKKWSSKWADKFLLEDFGLIKAQFENIGSKIVDFQNAT